MIRQEQTSLYSILTNVHNWHRDLILSAYVYMFVCVYTNMHDLLACELLIVIYHLPARTAVPTQESTPERKELNGNDPTIAM